MLSNQSRTYRDFSMTLLLQLIVLAGMVTADQNKYPITGLSRLSENQNLGIGQYALHVRSMAFICLATFLSGSC